jgi:hypothetical protein
MNQLEKILIKNVWVFWVITDYNYRENKVSVFDLSKNNEKIISIDTTNPEEFSKYLFDIMKEGQAKIWIWKYAENRDIYRTSWFISWDARTIHLWIDLSMEPYSNIYCPYDWKVQSFQNNVWAWDYWPTIILEHELDWVTFYTLYGHLSLESLDGLYEWKIFKKWEKLCQVWNYPVNWNRFPHLHFQIISDMLWKKWDFYWVASEKQKDYFLSICPNPNYILQIPWL